MALCITRRHGQSLSIGEANVTVFVNSTGKIRLLIDAPEHVKITRPDMKKGAPSDEDDCSR